VTDTQGKDKRRRWGRVVLFGVPAALAVLALLALGAFGLARSDTGRRWIADAIEHAASTPGELEVTIERLDGRLPQEIRLTGVRLRDAAGVWFSAGSLVLDWSPVALLSNKLQITSLRAGDSVLERLPETRDAEQSAPSGLPSLPFEIAVERLTVEDLTLGEAILGQRGRFRIEGRAAAEEAQGIATSLTVARSDGEVGRVELNALFQPRENHLSLTATIEEPAGGLIAHLGGVFDLPALTARLEGDGALSDWRGQLTLELEGLTSLEMQIGLIRDTALRFDAAGTARVTTPGELLPPAIPPSLLAGDLSFWFKGLLDDERLLNLERAGIESAAARLALSGNVALDTLTLEVEAAAELRDPRLGATLLPGLRTEDLSVSARIVGPALQPRIDAHLRAAELSTPEVRVSALDANFSFEPARPLNRGPPEGAIGSEGTFAGLEIDGAEALAPFLESGLRWQMTGHLTDNGNNIEAKTVTIAAGPVRLAASGALDLQDENLEVAASLNLTDLTSLAPWLGMAPRGLADIEAWIQSPDLGQTVSAIVTGELRDFGLNDPILHALLGGTSSLAANLSLAADGAVTARDIVLDTPSATVAGSLAMAADFAHVDADYDVKLRDVAVLAEPLGTDLTGRADLRGRVLGELANPNLSGQATLAEAQIEGIAIDRLDLKFTAGDLATAAAGQLDARAVTELGEIALVTDFIIADPDLRFTNLRAQSRGATLDGAVTVPMDGRPLSGTLKGRAPDLTPWLALADLAGSGAVDTEILLSGDGTQQNLAATAQVTVPVLRLDADRVLTGESLNVDVAVSDLFGTLKGQVNLDAAAVAVDELGFETLSLALDGGPEDVAWRLAAEGAWRGPLNVSADGRLKIGTEGQSLEVAHLQGQALDRDIALHAPVTLTQTDDAAELGPLDLRFGEAVMQAQGRIDPTEISAQLVIEALPISNLSAILPTEGVKGTLNTRIALAGPRANPSGDGEIHVSGIDLESLLQGPILGLDATARWREGRLSIAGAMTGLPGDDARLTAEVPLRLDPASLAPVVAPEEAIVGQVTWRGDMASIWPLVPIAGHQLSGDMEVALTAAGTAAQPRLKGAVSLSGGAYENLEAGTLLKDLNARIEFDDRRARLASLSANDGAAGTVSASGEIAIDAAAKFPLSIDARLTDFVAVRRDEVDAVLDGEVAVTGTAPAVLITGRFETKLVEIRIVEGLPPEVVTLNVVETGPGANTEALEAAPAKTEADGTVDLDIEVAMPRRVFVRGRGLDSEWAGNLKVTGPASEPNTVGEVKLVRGQLLLLTKTFRLTEGILRFPSGVDAVPELEVTAEHKAEDITAIAEIDGPITNPTVTLSSSPELPQDEIVSTVLFGKKQGQLSPLEAAQLAVAVAELAGAGGAGGIMDTARRLIGVDVLRISGGDDAGTSEPSVEAGTYATEGVYVGVKQGVTEESGAVAVEIEVTPNIAVESEVGITGESDIGIKFKWDY